MMRVYQAVDLVLDVFPGSRVAGGGRVARGGLPQAEWVHKLPGAVNGDCRCRYQRGGFLPRADLPGGPRSPLAEATSKAERGWKSNARRVWKS